MLLEVFGRRAVGVRPAHYAVDSVDPRRWRCSPEWRAAAMHERSEIEQHRHLAARVRHEGERLQDEVVGQPGAVRRVGDDVLRTRPEFLQEVDTGNTEAPIIQVGADDAEVIGFQD